MTEAFFVVEEAAEGGLTAKALNGSIFTEAETLEELRTSVKEAVECHFEENDKPDFIRLHIVKEFELIVL